MYRILHIPTAKYIISGIDFNNKTYPLIFEFSSLHHIERFLNDRLMFSELDNCIQAHHKAFITPNIKGQVKPLNRSHLELIEVDDV